MVRTQVGSSGPVADASIKLPLQKSFLRLRRVDEVKFNAADSVGISEAFFAQIERRYGDRAAV